MPMKREGCSPKLHKAPIGEGKTQSTICPAHEMFQWQDGEASACHKLVGDAGEKVSCDK